MTLIVNWYPTFYSIIFLALWIFTNTTLILYSQTMKKVRNQSKNVNLLFVMGIILLTQKSIWFFLPEVYLFSWPFPDAGELFVYQTITFAKTFIPLILDVFLGITLTIYFYSNFYRNNRKVLAGPGLYLLGAIILLFTSVYNFTIITIDFKAYIVFISITRSIVVVGLSFIFLYSIYINNNFFIMFCGLLFASELVFLFSNIDSTIYEFIYPW